MSDLIPVSRSGETLMLEKLLRLVNLIEAEVPGKPEVPAGTIFLTSAEYGALMNEVKARINPPEAFLQQRHFLVGRVTVRNAGTDDRDAVFLANKVYAEQTGFAWKRDNLITGRA